MEFKKIMELSKEEQKKVLDTMSKKELADFCRYQLDVLDRIRKKLFL